MKRDIPFPVFRFYCADIEQARFRGKATFEARVLFERHILSL